MSKITIAVATHKKYQMPSDSIYLPVQSGAELNNTNLGFQKDNLGDNISTKNPYYCELTALYWLWKNVDSDYKGLAHYRRHFSNKKQVSLFSTGKFEEVLDKKTLSRYLLESDVILPNLRKYYIETISSHYNHSHHEQDIITTKEIIRDKYPEYLPSFEIVLSRSSAHMFNMFIMKNNYFNSYCEWVFDILEELEQKLDISDYSAFDQRVFGRVSEILLDVWINYNQISYKEVPVMFMEKQNWIQKCSKFILQKIK